MASYGSFPAVGSTEAVCYSGSEAASSPFPALLSIGNMYLLAEHAWHTSVMQARGSCIFPQYVP